ncbi:hypothetical protein [Chromobacterium sp. ASV23]|uniref:hypothetical protein n=1 Tax=Chromobacterium sp. ASV23 TaxID=2795110 RepID=UPI0018ECFC9E|nr:hypothetical protein [Chromobacterium sp. ASV23]
MPPSARRAEPSSGIDGGATAIVLIDTKAGAIAVYNTAQSFGPRPIYRMTVDLAF